MVFINYITMVDFIQVIAFLLIPQVPCMMPCGWVCQSKRWGNRVNWERSMCHLLNHESVSSTIDGYEIRSEVAEEERRVVCISVRTLPWQGEGIIMGCCRLKYPMNMGCLVSMMPRSGEEAAESNQIKHNKGLTIGLLVTSTCGWTTELLCLTTTVVSN